MKVCLFGGTFDPPHIGHLLIAQTVCEAEGFDKIIFVPACHAPHKDKKDVTPVDKRLKMLELAVADNPNFEISDLEIRRGGISYSIDTIRTVKKKLGLSKAQLYFLIGSDTLKKFHTWKDPYAILEECQVLVALRPGFKPSSIDRGIMEKVQFANIPRIEISSTTIRQRWRENKTIRYMVTQPVWEFIHKNNLYSR